MKETNSFAWPRASTCLKVFIGLACALAAAAVIASVILTGGLSAIPIVAVAATVYLNTAAAFSTASASVASVAMFAGASTATANTVGAVTVGAGVAGVGIGLGRAVFAKTSPSPEQNATATVTGSFRNYIQELRKADPKDDDLEQDVTNSPRQQ